MLSMVYKMVAHARAGMRDAEFAEREEPEESVELSSLFLRAATRMLEAWSVLKALQQRGARGWLGVDPEKGEIDRLLERIDEYYRKRVDSGTATPYDESPVAVASEIYMNAERGAPLTALRQITRVAGL